MTTADLLRELGIPFVEGGSHKSVRSGWLGVETCPFCGHGDYYAGIPADKFAFSCWACGSRPFTQAVLRLSPKRPREVYDLLQESPGFREYEAERQSLKGKYELPCTPDGLKWAHVEYLRSRKIDQVAAVKLWQVSGFGHLAGRYAWSLFLPVYHNGQAVSWTTRKIGDAARRYDSAPKDKEALPIKSLLYGGDLVRNSCVVVEGPMDALRIGPGAVATFGAKVTPQQVAKIAKIPLRVVCFDSAGDATGEREGQRLANELAPHDGRTILVELDAKDAAESSDKEIRNLRKWFLD